MSDVKTATVAAMRAALDEHYTKHPTSATVSVPLPVLASAAQAAVAEVGIDRIPAIPAYNPDVTPQLSWREPGAEYAYAPSVRCVAVNDDGSVSFTVDNEEANIDIRLPRSDARAFALAILSAVTEADSND
jgi:hypothetical protein